MPDSPPEPKTPPPLEAFGGWTSADWFSAAILADTDIVGITLPKLGRLRKQVFRLVERSATIPGKGRAPETPPLARRQSMSARLGQILDAHGVTRAAAFGRAKLLFDPAPTLFFAELPLARIKFRAANRLRQTFIEHGLRACTLQLDRGHAIVMVWPSTETEITAFVDAAAPPHPMHIQFDQAEDSRAAPAKLPAHAATKAKDQPLGARERARLHAERTALLQQVQELRAQVEKMQKSQSALGAMEQLGLDDARLKSMLRLLHPDKHGGSEAATEAAKWLNGLRDLLKAGG